MSTKDLAEKIRNLSIYTGKKKTELKNELNNIFTYRKYLYGCGKKLSTKLIPTEPGIKKEEKLLEFLYKLHSYPPEQKKTLINENMTTFNSEELYIIDFIIYNRSTTTTNKTVYEKFKIHSFKSYDIDSEKPLEMTYPAFVQHKLDGMRLYVTYDGTEVGAFSKNFTDYKIPSSIKKELDELAPYIKKHFKNNFILEGEIYGKNRSKCNGILRKKEISDDESLLFNLDLWDIFPYDVLKVFETKKDIGDITITKDVITYKVSYKKRYNFLKGIIQKKKPIQVGILESVECNNYEEVKKIYDEKVKEGAEGIMVKPMNAYLYLGSTKLDLTSKLKARFDSTLKFVEFKRGKAQTNSNFVGSIEFSSSDGIVRATISNFTDDKKIPWNPSDLEKAKELYSIVKVYFYGINEKNKYGHYLLQNAHLATNLEITINDTVDSSEKILKQFSIYSGDEIEDETREQLITTPGRIKNRKVEKEIEKETYEEDDELY